jgi:nicotinamide-nucleotide amidase
MVFSEVVWEQLRKIYAIIGKPVTEDMREQCYFPSSARVLPNKMGTAPGLLFEANTNRVFVMPGVPFEMEHLMQEQFIPIILSSKGEQVITMKTLATVGEGESVLSRQIEDIEAHLPDGIKIAYLPALGRVRIRVSGIGHPGSQIRTEVDRIAEEIAGRIGDVIYATRDISLAEAIGETLRGGRQTISVAESCTGGFLAHLFTSNAGSSDYFAGGAVTYSNVLKKEILGVQEETIQSHGAVSEATVLEMADGARTKFHTDFAIAVSGIAGPGGGTDEKPVGTVWIAVSGPDGVEAHHFRCGKDRLRNIELSAVKAMDLLRKRL